MAGLQDVDLKAAQVATGGKEAVKAAHADWKHRRAALARAEAAGWLPPRAPQHAVNRYCEANALPCLLAERPQNVLGVVSEAFGDALGSYVSECGFKKSKDFQTTMFLRCAPVCRCWYNSKTLKNTADCHI